MRATAQDPEAARLMGINVDTTISLTFLLGGMLAGAAGLVYALYETTIWYFQGFEAGLIAFTAAVMGGIGNIRGAVLGGLIIGCIQQLSDARIGPAVDAGDRVRLPDPDHGAAAARACSARRRGRPDERAGRSARANGVEARPAAPRCRRGGPRALAARPDRRSRSCCRSSSRRRAGSSTTTIIALAYVVMALGLNVVVGFAGLLDLGYVAFFALGAYTRRLVRLGLLLQGATSTSASRRVAVDAARDPPQLRADPGRARSLITRAAGAIIGLPTLRLRGDYIAIVTLAFGEIIRVFAVNGDEHPPRRRR